VRQPTEKRGIVIPLAFACAALGVLVRSSFSSAGVTAIVLCTLSLLVIMWRLALTWRENSALLRLTQEEALTDALTGLGNRRALMLELEARMLAPDAYGPYLLGLFDLDGFKHYNDSFGHPAGDALLKRLGNALRSELGAQGTVYRMGGDEFCVLLADRPESLAAAAVALTEHGEGFAISCSYGVVRLPTEAVEIAAALRIADQRMYAHKHSSRLSPLRQTGDVLLRALHERDPELRSHMQNVAELAEATAARFGLPPDEVVDIRHAAELHDVGKMAIPDAILNKPGRLSEEEWVFIRRHTLIGERILLGAPALRRVASLVRASHENFDGGGYPDGLAGTNIPLGARIIAVCDAFHAMITDRPYREAMDENTAIAELRRCAGSQFDPAVVEQFCEALAASEAVLDAPQPVAR
jgi:diguanylate cyclase (GGDEF)-like protein